MCKKRNSVSVEQIQDRSEAAKHSDNISFAQQTEKVYSPLTTHYSLCKKAAYTISEFVIVILVITVVAGICINVNLPVSSSETLQSIPRNGEDFCKYFVSYTNTSPSLIGGGEECKGDEISDGTTDFSDKTPDVVLRNGMRVYNLSSGKPVKIEDLDGNSKGKTYTRTDGAEVDLDEFGYIVYMDIDGTKGPNTLWLDVFPFYITLTGSVIPAYDTANPETSGGDSSYYLQTSVYDNYIDSTGRRREWYVLSKSFKEGACTQGYVSDDTPYCKNNTAVTKHDNCKDNEHDCRLKRIMPVKFFLWN